MMWFSDFVCPIDDAGYCVCVCVLQSTHASMCVCCVSHDALSAPVNKHTWGQGPSRPKVEHGGLGHHNSNSPVTQTWAILHPGEWVCVCEFRFMRTWFPVLMSRISACSLALCIQSVIVSRRGHDPGGIKVVVKEFSYETPLFTKNTSCLVQS